MLLGIGTDIVQNSRFLGKNKAFLSKLFSTEEIAKIEKEKSEEKRAECAASLFALKEAASKAIGLSLFDVGIKNISVHNNECGAPEVSITPLLFKKVREHHKLSTKAELRFLASVSHEKEYSVAFVTLESVGVE